jgi:hypothetical protein
MGTLTKCLKKIGLEKHEQAIIRGYVQDHLSDGYDAHQAAMEAVSQYLDDLRTERQEIISEIRKQIKGFMEEKPEIPMEEASTNQKRNTDFVPHEGDGLLTAIAKLGGVNSDEAIQQGIDTPYVKGKAALRGHKILRVFTKGGQSFDNMAENLRQYGFNVNGANALLAQMDEAIRSREKNQITDIKNLEQGRVNKEEARLASEETHGPIEAPGFYFEENEYTSDQDANDRHLMELLTELDNLNPQARETIINEADNEGLSVEQTIPRLQAEIERLTRIPEVSREQTDRTSPKTEERPVETSASVNVQEKTKDEGLTDKERDAVIKAIKEGARNIKGYIRTRFPDKFNSVTDAEIQSIEEEAQGTKFSRMPEPGPASTIESARAELRQSFGKAFNRLERSGLVSIRNAPEGLDPTITAQTKNGLVTLYADRIAPGEFLGKLLHEAGGHIGLRQMFGDDFTKLADNIRTLAESGDKHAIAVENHVRNLIERGELDQKDTDEERIAYAIEYASNETAKGLTARFRLWVSRVMAKLKVWIAGTPWYKKAVRNGLTLKFTPHDLAALARESVNQLIPARERTNAIENDLLRGEVRYYAEAPDTDYERISSQIEQIANAVTDIVKSAPEETKPDMPESVIKGMIKTGDRFSINPIKNGPLGAAFINAWFAKLDGNNIHDAARRALTDAAYSKYSRTPIHDDPFNNPKDVVRNLVGAEERILPHWADVATAFLQGFDKLGAKERKEILGVLSLRNLGDLAEDVGVLPVINKEYVPIIQKMVAAQNRITTDADKVANVWLKLYKSNPGANNELVDLMSDETTEGIDGSKPWVSKLDAAQMEEYQSGKPGKETLKAIRKDKIRKALYGDLKKRYEALPKAFQAMHDQVRDMYQRWFDKRYQALLERIKEEEGTSTAKKARMDKVRAVFESFQTEGPYFPLPRFGDYWVQGRSQKGDLFVEAFETLEEQKEFIRQVEADGDKILAQGVKPYEFRQTDGVSADFVGKVDELVQTLGDSPAVEEVRDGMYQLYLQTLPSISNRKHSIHRKNRIGWSRDMLRAFADIGLHEAKQYSKLVFGHQLNGIISDINSGIGMAENPAKLKRAELKLDALSDAFNFSDKEGKEAIKNMMDRIDRRMKISKTAKYHGNFEFARNLEGELKQQYENMMNPASSSWAVALNGLGFGWYLGGSIMSGVVNSLQNVWTINAAAAEFQNKHGLMALPKVAIEFAKAAKDFLTHLYEGQLDIAGGLKTIGERRAYVQFSQHELFDKTQQHDLGGLSSEGFKYGSFARYMATKLGLFFHHAERFNRQVSAMAIYRTAIKAGIGQQQATDMAERLVWKTHYDYSSWNRARLLRGSTARVMLQFKQYSLSTAFLMGEAWYKSVWKDSNISPEDRKKARAFFGGVMASQLILAGAKGLPIGMMKAMAVASALGARGIPFTKAMNIGAGITGIGALALLMGLGDDPDNPDDFVDDPETWVREWLASHAGQNWERIIMDGLVDSLTPIGLSSRLSLNGILYRSQDRELEGKDAWAAAAQTIAGPVAGGMTSDAALAWQMIDEGEIWKGLEHLMPTAARGVSKALRGQVKGITNAAGNPIVEDITPTESALQFIGDTPSRINLQYDINNAEKNREARIANRRKQLLREYNRATRGEADMADVMKETERFNKQNPEDRITRENREQSRKQKKRIARKSEGGVYLKHGRQYEY